MKELKQDHTRDIFHNARDRYTKSEYHKRTGLEGVDKKSIGGAAKYIDRDPRSERRASFGPVSQINLVEQLLIDEAKHTTAHHDQDQKIGQLHCVPSGFLLNQMH